MITHSSAFLNLKKQQQFLLNFMILQCHAIPSLKKMIAGNEEGVDHFSVPKPDYFGSISPNSRLLEIIPHYKENLARYMHLSAFSFFESYFVDLAEEILVFHGGIENMLSHSKGRLTCAISPSAKESLSKLREPFKKEKSLKYKKHIEILNGTKEFRFPSEKFSYFGLKQLFEHITSDSFRSHRIPDLLVEGFMMEMDFKNSALKTFRDKTDKEMFHICRDYRNKIAHGDKFEFPFQVMMEMNNFMRDLSIRIDQHVVENFLYLEDFRG